MTAHAAFAPWVAGGRASALSATRERSRNGYDWQLACLAFFFIVGRLHDAVGGLERCGRRPALWAGRQRSFGARFEDQFA